MEDIGIDLVTAYKNKLSMRYKTWHWGKWIKRYGNGLVIDQDGHFFESNAFNWNQFKDFEIYSEELHGNHNEKP